MVTPLNVSQIWTEPLIKLSNSSHRMLTVRLRLLSHTSASLNNHALQFVRLSSKRTNPAKTAAQIAAPLHKVPVPNTATVSVPREVDQASAVAPVERKRALKYRYVGEMVDDARHGEGTCTFEDGTVYQGGFAKGKFHGLGKFTLKNGISCEGNYVNGVREGSFTFR